MGKAILTYLMVAIGFVGLVLLMTVPIAILGGWVLTWLWFWFAVPYGLPVLTLVPAIGISLLVKFLVHQSSDDSKVEHEEISHRLIQMVSYPLVALGMGYVIHLFM